jgi:hypothetical protein
VPDNRAAPGPFAVTHRALARRWQFLDTMPPGLAALDAVALGQLLHDDSTLTCKPKYAKVSGDVPLQEAAASQRVVVTRCQLDVFTPGEFTF